MSALAGVRLVATRELRERLRRKSFWIVFAVLLLGSSAGAIVPELVKSGRARYDVATVGEQPTLRDSLQSLGPALDATIAVRTTDDAATAEQLVDSGAADVALVAGAPPTIIVRAGQHATLVGAVRQALATDALARELERRGLTAGEVGAALRQAPPTLQELDADAESRRGAAFVVSLVLYILLLSLMVQVANGVAIEKANRISEVLLPIVRPGDLLFGKVLGVGVAGTALLAAGAVPVGVKLAVGGSLPAGLGLAVLTGAAWFVGGLAFYLTVAGSLGALVERPEDVGSAVTPLSIILVATFLVAQSAPSSALAAVLAYVPLTSPVLAPTRVAVGASGPMELVGSLVLLAVGVVAVGVLGSRVYARAVVRTGRRLRLTDVLRRPH